MSYNLVTSMNQIVQEWKSAYVDALRRHFVTANIPQNLDKETWRDILITSHNIFDGLHVQGGAISNMFLGRIINDQRHVESEPEVADFYQSIFGGVKDAITSFENNKFGFAPDVAPKDAYIIMPNHSPYNNGRPLGMHPINQNVIEVLAISDNKWAYQIDPILYWNTNRKQGFVMQIVPDLPRQMLEFARRYQISVR